jgi:Tfp pilus assembly protein PilF
MLARKLIFVLAVFALAAAAQNKGQTVRRLRVADDTVGRAEAAIEKKDYAAAEQELQKAVQHDANDYRAWFDLAFVYNATGRQPEAIQAYRRSVAANPKVFESNLNLGLMLARAGLPEAETYLRAATQLTPSSNAQAGLAGAWMALGQVTARRDPKAALQSYLQAAKLRPSDAGAHLAAAALAEQLKDFPTAEQEYRAAAAADPKSDEALAGLVNVFVEQGRLDDAEAALRRYVTADPENAAAHVQLGRILASLHRRPEAVAELETALKLAPGNSSAARELGGLYLQDKQYDKAEAQFRALLAQLPQDGDLHYGLGLALLNQKKFADAQAELLMAVKLKPDIREAYESLATAASENKDYALAIRALAAHAKLLPETPWTLFLRATAYDHLRDYEQAATNYRQFLALSNGRFPDQEWQARHRLVAIAPRK